MSLVFVGEVINEENCIHHIIDNVYLGNCNSRNFILNHNISRIIEIGEQDELDKYPQIPQNFDKLTVKIPDNRNVNIQPYLQDVWEFIQKDGENVLIHCKMGTSRSVAFVISYLIQYKDMTFEQALSYIKDLRGDSMYTKPNIGFTKILRKLKN